MGKEGMNQLSEDLFQHMQQHRLVLLSTMLEQDKPYVNAVSWTYAKTPKQIRFAVDGRSQIVTNVKQNSAVAMTVFHNETIYSMYGEAKVLTEEIEGIPFKLAMIEVTISSIHDVMFYGAKISAPPEYEKTYNPEAAKKLDDQVLDALKA